MVVKGNDVIGLKVFTIAHGKQVADVKDIVYDPSQNKVQALLIDEGGWLSDAKVLLFGDLRTIGKDAVIIDTENKIKKAGDVSPRIAHIAKDDTYLTKTKIITEDGADLGQVTDVLFNSESGAVEEFEVSQGVLENIKSGKKRVKVSDIITVGEDATIVRGYTEEVFEDQAQEKGLQGAVNTAMEQGKQLAAKARDTAQTKASEARQYYEEELKPEVETRVKKTRRKVTKTANSPETKAQVQNLISQAKKVTSKTQQKASEAQDRILRNKREDAVGKYLAKNILAPDDQILATRGDVVTHELLHEAERFGLLDQVLNNISDLPGGE